MVDGAIDGRGGATHLGQSVSWWNLAHTAKVMICRRGHLRGDLAASGTEHVVINLIT